MRCKRKKQTVRFALTNNFFLKMRLLPWKKEGGSWTWLVSLAVSKSNRQINDWLNERKNQRCKKLRNKLTGKYGPLTQAVAVRQLRKWFDELPCGDTLFFRCESVVSQKQFQVWEKWFTKHESSEWLINSEYKYFLRCK